MAREGVTKKMERYVVGTFFVLVKDIFTKLAPFFVYELTKSDEYN